jgi:[ribosomal protein S18]-alanine N-acetyltransferase
MSQVKIDWLLGGNIPRILEIEKVCYSDPWDEATLKQCMRKTNVIGKVACLGTTLVGYCLYESHEKHFHLINFSVHPDFHRTGVGCAMMSHLRERLSGNRRSSIRMIVSERCDGAHLFLRSMGFRAWKVERNYFHIGNQHEDAYHFRYDVGDPYRHVRARQKVKSQGDSVR